MPTAHEHEDEQAELEDLELLGDEGDRVALEPLTFREKLRELRRPVILATISIVCLVTHYFLLRTMAHHHIAHVLLGAGNAPPPLGAAVLAIALVIVRFISVILVPGLMLAAAAEVIAYLLVGPKRVAEEEEALDLAALSERPRGLGDDI